MINTLQTRLKTIGLMLVIALLSGCATQKIMPPIRYNKPIDFKVSKKAVLSWTLGKEYAGSIPGASTSHDSGLIGALVVSAMDDYDRKKNPSKYTLSYGKAEQVIFMTSLKSTLEQNGVFKSVELSTEPAKNTHDVRLNITFKSARVSPPHRELKVTLSVEMTILSAGLPEFKRTYVVESDLEKGGTFIDHQADASTKLLEKIIMGLEQWHTQSKSQMRKKS